jgi:hypothetical protein
MAPVAPIVLFLIEWLVAGATLGHIPRGGIDDPKSISALSGFLHAITTLGLMAFVPISVFGMFTCATRWGVSKRTVTVVGVGVAMIPGTIAVLGSFPWDAFGWWLD